MTQSSEIRKFFADQSRMPLDELVGKYGEARWLNLTNRMRAHRAPDGVIELCDDSCDHGRPWETAAATFNPHCEWGADD